jgi:hypothetical protein
VSEVERGQIESEGMSSFELNIEEGEPIRGYLSASGTGALPFHGWLELAAAIQTMRHQPAAGGATVSLPSG